MDFCGRRLAIPLHGTPLDVTAIDAAIRHDDGADTEEDDGLDNGTYTMHCRHFTQNGFCLLTSQDCG